MYHNDRQSDDSFQLSLFYFLIDKEETFPVFVTVSPFHPRYGSFFLALLVYNLFSFRLLALNALMVVLVSFRFLIDIIAPLITK